MTPVAEPSEWTLTDLRVYVGGLSNPSKMPGFGYSLPAQECTTGSKLRVIEGTTCSHCYAFKGRYNFPKVKSALYRRLESITKPLWARVMAELIGRTEDEYFRWHDSGDLQSTQHLERIVEICNLTPAVKHWLPTREYKIVSRFITNGGVVPPNLTIRLSAHMIDGPAPNVEGCVASTVSTQSACADSETHVCPAPTQGNNCGSCRACWDSTVAVVAYHLH